MLSLLQLRQLDGMFVRGLVSLMHAKQVSVAAGVLVATVCCTIAGDAEGKFQIGPYIGTTLSSKVTDAHGDHINSSFRFVDTKVGDIDVNQGMALGIKCAVLFQ